MGTTLAKNLLPSLSCKRYMLRISSELLAAIRQLDPSCESASCQLFGHGTSMLISFHLRRDQYSLQITTVQERSLVEEALESILSATEETRRISQSMGNWRKSIVVA